MRHRNGFTLIELLATLAIGLTVAGALIRVFMDSTTSHAFVIGQNDAETQARQPLDTLLDHLRNAQAVKILDYAVIESGSASSVTYFASNNPTDFIRYFLDGTELKRTEAGVTNIVLTNVQELEFTYFKVDSLPASYYTGAVTTDDQNVPTSPELSLLARIDVRVIANVDGYYRELGGSVRLRNSPRKKRL